MAERILVDTSAWIDAFRKDGDSEIRNAVRSATAEGRAVLCDMVRVELWNGAGGSSERKMLRELERNLECLPTNSDVWKGAIDLARSCRRKGLTIPATDLVIAACASHHRVGLLHHDTHFDQIRDIL